MTLDHVTEETLSSFNNGRLVLTILGDEGVPFQLRGRANDLWLTSEHTLHVRASDLTSNSQETAPASILVFGLHNATFHHLGSARDRTLQIMQGKNTLVLYER